MHEITIDHYIALSMFMFTCGVLGVIIRKNIIFILMSLELILNATNILFVSASTQVGNLNGQIMTFFIITVAACEAGVALAMVIAIYRRYGTIKTDFLKLLRG
jgi:NADH-quinone oxidoreductase subunit K